MLRLAVAGLVRHSSCVSAQWHWSFALCSSSSASQEAPPVVRQQACRRFRPLQQPYAPEWDLTEGKEEEIEKQKRDWNGKDKMSMWPYKWHDKYGMTPEKWEYYNKVVWPPNYLVPETGKPKAPEVYHCRESVKYSPKKMWFVCELVRGRSVDDALQQLSFTFRKGAQVMHEIITEAKKRASDEFNIEYPSNTFIAEAFPIQSRIVYGARKQAKERWCKIRYRYTNVFIRLEEGEGGHSGREPPPTGWTKMEDYYQYLRERRIKYPL